MAMLFFAGESSDRFFQEASTLAVVGMHVAHAVPHFSGLVDQGALDNGRTVSQARNTKRACQVQIATGLVRPALPNPGPIPKRRESRRTQT